MIPLSFQFVRSISRPALKVVFLISRRQIMKSRLLPSAAMVERLRLVAVNIRSIKTMYNITNAQTNLHSYSPFSKSGTDHSIRLTLSQAGTSSSSISHILSTGFEKFLDLITLNASLPGKCCVNTKLTAVDETAFATHLSVSQSSITSSFTGSLRTQSRNLTDLTTSLKLSSAKESLTTAMKVIPTSTTFG